REQPIKDPLSQNHQQIPTRPPHLSHQEIPPPYFQSPTHYPPPFQYHHSKGQCLRNQHKNMSKPKSKLKVNTETQK
ncbi:hypothetical protein Leryth_024746, partial [Lithospermum erythrorhizon]